MSPRCVHIFDCDDTFVHYGRGRFLVPRQTFHKLRHLKQAGHRTGAISFNVSANRVLALTGALKYIDVVIVPHSSEESRADLMTRALRHFVNLHPLTLLSHSIHYYDDRVDNITNVLGRYPHVVAHRVSCALQLYTCLSDPRIEVRWARLCEPWCSDLVLKFLTATDKHAFLLSNRILMKRYVHFMGKAHLKADDTDR